MTDDELVVEQAARTICAHSLGGFCQNVGGDHGCKVGRGHAPDPALCVATRDQLLLSGNLATAEAVVARFERTLPSVEVLREAALNFVECFSSRTAREANVYEEWDALDKALHRSA